MNLYTYVPVNYSETPELEFDLDTIVSLHASNVVREVYQNIEQILDSALRSKVTLFIQRFEHILTQELKLSRKWQMLRSLSLYCDEDYAEITWTFVNFGAGFVFERDKDTWFYFMSDDTKTAETFGPLTSENCANTIRDVIRYVTK